MSHEDNWGIFMRKISTGFAGLATLMAGIAAAPASADIAVSYFSVAQDGKDFGPATCCFVSHDEVLGTLGPDGLPVVNTSTTSPHPLQDFDPTTHELTWFTPSAGVTNTSNTTISGNSFTNGNFNTPDGTGPNDSQGFFQTAIFSGSFSFATPQSFSFSIGADDDAWLFVDGTQVVQLGGVHGVTIETDTVALSAGLHTFKLFYADQQAGGAALNFSIPDNVIVTVPTAAPEPASWAMMLGGFGAIGGALRNRRKAAVRFA
jgi:fibro-slime domain-containing protein